MSTLSNIMMKTMFVANLVTFASPFQWLSSDVEYQTDVNNNVILNKDDQYRCTDYLIPLNESYNVEYDPLPSVNMAHHVLLMECPESNHTESTRTCLRICRYLKRIQMTWSEIVTNQDFIAEKTTLEKEKSTFSKKKPACEGGVVDAVSGTRYTPPNGVDTKGDLTVVRELLVYGTDPCLQIQTGNDPLETNTTTDVPQSENLPEDSSDAETKEIDGSTPSMKDYWIEHSKDASMQEMMLDNDAEELSKDELPEILSYLPKYDGMDVVELGAGIGRFTTQLAQKARKVLAVDFMENFIEKNREINKNMTNIDYLAADVMDMELKSDDWDIVFSNWLYMYLDNDQLTYFLQNTLSWLRTDGYMFCRESCLQQSGSKVRTINPTYYRDPLVYESLFTSVTIPTEDGRGFYGFEKVFSKSVDTYIKMKNNENQLVWLIQKVRRGYDTAKNFAPLPELKEQRQLETSHILRREELVGRGFIRTGGLHIAKMTAEMLKLRASQKVLDFSCGIGGFSIHIAKTYGVNVVASDPSSTSVQIGRERAKEEGVTQIKFEVASIERRIHNPESFDGIYSRDAIGNITDKLSLLRRLHDAMKPGGRLLMSEYCIDEEIEDIDIETDVFDEELDHNSNVPRKVLSTGAILDMIKEVGFVKVTAVDKTDDILRALESELLLVKERSNAECLDTLTVRRKVVNKLKSGNAWMFFYAEKQKTSQ